MSEPIKVPPGLYGVSVAETALSRSGGDGSLTYRGYDIKELFHQASFEECVFLVLEGKLPSKSELSSFTSELRAHAKVPERIYALVRNLPPGSHPMDVLRTAVSGLGTVEASLPAGDQQLSLIAKMPALVANCYRIVNGMEVVEPVESLTQSGNLLYMLSGKRPDSFDSRAFEKELILYLEHDLNVSTFTVRVVASTLADVYAASTAGLAALKGPLHGGANEAAMQMLLEIGSADRAAAYISDALSHGKKVMGFGHRVYKKVDPRAQLSKELLRDLLQHRGAGGDLYKLCEEVERVMFETKKLPANLDFYAAPIFYTLGIPIEVYTPIFASSRIVGWVAHYNEQLKSNKLFRPDSTYVGPSALKYSPIENR